MNVIRKKTHFSDGVFSNLPYIVKDKTVNEQLMLAHHIADDNLKSRILILQSHLPNAFS